MLQRDGDRHAGVFEDPISLPSLAPERDTSSRQPAGSNPIVAVNRVWPMSRSHLSAARAGSAAADAALGEPGDRYCLPRQDGGDGLGDRGFTGSVAAGQEGSGRALDIGALRPSKVTNFDLDHATAFCDIWRSARAFLKASSGRSSEPIERPSKHLSVPRSFGSLWGWPLLHRGQR